MKISAKILLIIVFGLQIMFWIFTNKIKPSFIITPYPPTRMQIEALSFGDKQFYYRKLAFQLQNAGDKYGYLTNLKEYDYNRLVRWFEVLSDIDENSIYIPYMAAYYYSLVQNQEKLNILGSYLVSFALKNPEKYWNILTTASYIYYKNPSDISQKKIQEIGNVLAQIKTIPVWARVVSAFYLKNSNNICDAYTLIKQISNSDLMNKKQNADDKFLMELLNSNIEKLQNTGKAMLRMCEG